MTDQRLNLVFFIVCSLFAVGNAAAAFCKASTNHPWVHWGIASFCASGAVLNFMAWRYRR